MTLSRMAKAAEAVHGLVDRQPAVPAGGRRLPRREAGQPGGVGGVRQRHRHVRAVDPADVDVPARPGRRDAVGSFRRRSVCFN